VRGVKKVTSKGRTYYYHRRSGVRIEIDPSAEPEAFAARVHNLNSQGLRRVPKAPDGTLGGVIASYRDSSEFSSLAPRTKRDYLRVLNYLEPLSGMPLTKLSPAFVYRLRDMANQDHKRRFANYVLAVLSVVLNWGRLRGWLKDNPATGVPKVPRPKTQECARSESPLVRQRIRNSIGQCTRGHSNSFGTWWTIWPQGRRRLEVPLVILRRVSPRIRYQ